MTEPPQHIPWENKEKTNREIITWDWVDDEKSRRSNPLEDTIDTFLRCPYLVCAGLRWFPTSRWEHKTIRKPMENKEKTKLDKPNQNTNKDIIQPSTRTPIILIRMGPPNRFSTKANTCTPPQPHKPTTHTMKTKQETPPNREIITWDLVDDEISID